MHSLSLSSQPADVGNVNHSFGFYSQDNEVSMLLYNNIQLKHIIYK